MESYIEQNKNNAMEILRYAPVLIPTLNRVDKLNECLTSLQRCNGAENTDVYVAVDYPPSEKYVSGWELVCNLVDKISKSHKFHKFVVIKRERNYGICHNNSNSRVALKQLRKKYDRFIFSEDDNVFSPNFLEYMNKCLERFKDDSRICYISGYNYPFVFPSMYKNNFYITKDGSPWGMGGWFNRLDEIDQYYDLDFLKKLLRNKVTYKKLKARRPQTIQSIVHMLKMKQSYGDSCLGCYCAMEDKYWVLPTISKVKNLGNDGSGAHAISSKGINDDYYKNQRVDSCPTFEFTNDIFTYRPVELTIAEPQRKWHKELAKKMIYRFDLCCLKHFGFVPKYKYL